jgi:hypothetical protein
LQDSFTITNFFEDGVSLRRALRRTASAAWSAASVPAGKISRCLPVKNP